MKFLITRPNHEDTVFYLYKWSEELIKKAEQKGFTVLDCCEKKASKNTVEKMLEKQKPELVMFNGHGSPTAIFGQKNEPLIEQGKNEKLLKDKIVYSRSCSTAAQLGYSCITKGIKAFIGYKEDFAFWTDNSNTARPLKDKFAEPFLESSNQVIRSLLNGNTANEAHEKSQTAFDQQIEKFQRSNAPPESQYILPLLFWDKMNQTVLGDGSAKTN